jgi:hypothetical protein
MTGRFPAAALALALAVAAAPAPLGCGGDERQDADAPTGEFGLDVTRASFPARQSLAQPAVLRLAVRNTGHRAVPDLSVTVATAARGHVGADTPAFGTAVVGEGLADRTRPVWILDDGPAGGDTAYAGTWALGPLARGRTKRVRFAVTAARAGTYRLRWRVAPALEGTARAAPGGRTSGAFRVTISAAPVDARVGPRGRVVRGAS